MWQKVKIFHLLEIKGLAKREYAVVTMWLIFSIESYLSSCLNSFLKPILYGVAGSGLLLFFQTMLTMYDDHRDCLKR